MQEEDEDDDDDEESGSTDSNGSGESEGSGNAAAPTYDIGTLVVCVQQQVPKEEGQLSLNAGDIVQGVLLETNGMSVLS